MIGILGSICIFFGLFSIAGSFIIYIVNALSIALDDGQLHPWHPFPIFITGLIFLLLGILFLIPDYLYEKSIEKKKKLEEEG